MRGLSFGSRVQECGTEVLGLDSGFERKFGSKIAGFMVQRFREGGCISWSGPCQDGAGFGVWFLGLRLGCSVARIGVGVEGSRSEGL